jgi:hypothetical protein
MKFLPKKIINLLFLGIFLLNACSRIETANQNGNSSQAKQAANNSVEKIGVETVKDGVDELGQSIKLNFTPEETTWREENLTAPNGKKLIAILKFSNEDTDNVVRDAEKYRPAEASSIDTETWFPAELIAQSELSGDQSLKGASFAADDFLQSPYVKGKLTRIINTNYFILEMTTF